MYIFHKHKNKHYINNFNFIKILYFIKNIKESI